VHSVVKIDFEWLQFPDYHFDVRESQPPPRIPTAAHPTSGFDKPLVYLRGRGVPLKIRPLDEFPDLYLKLKDSDISNESHLGFARKYGLLSNEKFESSFEWERRVSEMQQLIYFLRNQEGWEVKNGTYVKYGLGNSFNLQFGRTISGDLELGIIPRDLYAAIYLQCVSSRATGAELRSCKACGKDFQIGGDSGQRSHRRFCSDGCRFKFSHRKRRGKS
jgi:hypothetical protein